MSGNAVLDAEASERREVSEPLRGDTRPERRTVNGTYQQAAVSAIVCGPSLMFGQWLGWSSAVQPLLQSSASPVGQLTEDQISWLATLLLIGGVPSPFLWSWLADRLGRKRTLLLSVIPSLIGCFLVSFHSAYYSLLISCFLGGVTGAAAFTVSPMYVGEIAHTKVRGSLGALIILSINSGLMVAYIVGGEVSFLSFNNVNICITIVQLILLFWVPETPRFLWMKGENKKAEETFLWLRAGDISSLEEELNEMKNDEKEESKLSYRELFNTKGKRKGVFISTMLFFFQQFSGILVVFANANYIFQKSGSSLSPAGSSMIIGGIQLFSSFVSSLVIEKSGRKLLLLISFSAMGTALITIGTYMYVETLGVSVSSFSWLPVVSLSLHVLGYALGAGPCALIVMNELFSPEIRGLASSFIIFLGTAIAVVPIALFPFLLLYFQLFGTMWFFGCFCCVGCLFIFKEVPETKGIPIQIIVRRLNGEVTDEKV